MRGAFVGQKESARGIVAKLSDIPGLDLTVCKNAEELAAAATSCDFLLLQQSFFSPEVEAACLANPALRWLQILSAGYDLLVGREIRPDITITNAGPSLAGAVADHAVALLLALTRGLVPMIEAQGRQDWQPRLGFGAISLDKRAALVIGLGYIGRRIATSLRGLGMTVTGMNQDGRPDPGVDRVIGPDRLDEALAEVDVIVIAVPLSAATLGLFGRERLKRCRPGAYLVNVGRGKVIDTDALLAVMEEGHFAGVGLDVIEPEPLPAGHPAWKTPRLLLTPHLAGSGASGALADFILRNVLAFCEGRPLEGVLDRRRLEKTAG